jgi:hypothetical protein
MNIRIAVAVMCLLAAGVLGVRSMQLGQQILDEVNSRLPITERVAVLNAWRAAKVYELHRQHFPASDKCRRVRKYQWLMIALPVLAWILIVS